MVVEWAFVVCILWAVIIAWNIVCSRQLGWSSSLIGYEETPVMSFAVLTVRGLLYCLGKQLNVLIRHIHFIADCHICRSARKTRGYFVKRAADVDIVAKYICYIMHLNGSCRAFHRSAHDLVEAMLSTMVSRVADHGYWSQSQYSMGLRLRAWGSWVGVGVFGCN